MSFIELIEISKMFDHGNNGVHSLSESIEQSTKVGIVGETGSGKSTLLKIIAGLMQPDSGSIALQGQKVLGPQEQLVAGHAEISYLSQHFELQRFVTVSQYLDRFVSTSEEETNAIVKACHIEHLVTKNTRELSGGEKQRVALAKELIQLPKVLLLDEPFSNLDLNHKKKIKEAISSIEKKWVNSILMASHDPSDVLPWADIIWVFQSGRIIQKGTPHQIYNHPINEYVAGLFGPYNLIDPFKWDLNPIKQFPTLNDKVMIRPEQFSVQLAGSSDGDGKVIKTEYHGSYEEILLESNGENLYIKSDINQFKEGDAVSIRIKN